jgi:threonine/homoserine/homoserine lactone efflux protein
MEITFCLKGIAAGFLLCAPLGPIGVLCLQRTMAAGRLAGFFAILGAAVVDGFYGLAAGFGMSVIETFLDEGRFWFQLFGGMALVVAGIRLCAASSSIIRPSQDLVRSSLDAILSTFTLMLSNPLPILVISAALSAMTGGKLRIDFSDIPLFALGLFVGSLLWSPIIFIASALVSSMLQPKHLMLINRICGTVIVGCGLALGAAWLVMPAM